MKLKSIVILIFIFLVVDFGGWYGCNAAFVPVDDRGDDSTSDQGGVQTSVVHLGDISIFASGTGQVIPAVESELSFDEGGVLVELLVGVGDQVKSGQVLARLRTNENSNRLAADIASAESALISSQQALNDLYENGAVDAALALVAVEEAQQTLDDLYDVDLERALGMQTITEAQKAVDDAEMELYILNSSASQSDLDTAHASLLFKEDELNEIEDQIATTDFKIRSATDEVIRERLEGQMLRLNQQLSQKQIDYEKALSQYESMDDPPNVYELAVAEADLRTALAQLTDAQREWEKIQDGVLPGEIARAEAELKAAKADWERLKNGPDQDDILLAEAELAAAQARLSSIQEQQLVLELLTPIDGVVTSIDAVTGETIGTGKILTIADLSQSLLDVYLDETDLDKVQVGHTVEVIFDAFPEKIYTGNIIEVDPSLTNTFGRTAVRALARLDSTSYAKPQQLPIGLNASVDVIAGQAVNALLVPVEAIHELDDGSTVVYVLTDDELERRRVSIRFMDFTSAEVLEGLEIGEIVAIGNIEK